LQEGARKGKQDRGTARIFMVNLKKKIKKKNKVVEGKRPAKIKPGEGKRGRKKQFQDKKRESYDPRRKKKDGGIIKTSGGVKRKAASCQAD